MLKRSFVVSISRASTAVLLLVLAAHLLWMLSMPAWPSQDGPVHLYYTRVLGLLFSHQASAYRGYFFVKHLLPPYAVYYYTLLFLSHFVSLLTADRLVICGYFISFVFGFRYAARAIGPNADVTSCLASLLLLNWALGMGFANYCLSLSFALWAIGLWLRLGAELQLGKRIAFVALLALITLSHPVPLLIVLAFAGLDLLCRFFFSRDPSQPARTQHFRLGWLTIACGSLCLLYVRAFTVAHPLQQRTEVKNSFTQEVLRRGKDILITKNVEILYGHWWEVEVYRLCLAAIILAGAGFALLQWRQNRASRRWAAGDSMTVFAVILLFALLLLPSDLSGAYYFNERLHILLWITFLLAGSAWRPAADGHSTGDTVHAGSASGAVGSTGSRHAELAGAFAIAFTLGSAVLLLHIADSTLRPFARHDYLMAHTDLPLRGQMAVVLDSGHVRRYVYAGPPWDPYYWDTVALLRHNDVIMENAPWLDSPIIPLAPTGALPGVVLSPQLANSPIFLAAALGSTPSLRNTLVDRADVVLFSPVHDEDRIAMPVSLGSNWSCKHEDGYRLCTKVLERTQARLLEAAHAPTK